MEGHGFGLDGSRGFASQLWAMLNEGGVWGVPRSGLLLRKEGNTFVVQDRMPWHPEMPWSQEEWVQAQADEIADLTTMFAGIGVVVQEIEL